MSLIENNIRKEIITRLKTIEEEQNIHIIFAIESGSRAWGFESVDSDYDVRFIYRHQLKWYLNVLPKRDVIEYPIQGLFDYAGWDIRKALFLINKSNPVLFEWLRSPIVYIKDELCFNRLVEASKLYFSPISSTYHYLSMAKGNFRDYLQGDIVKSKKYFYVLRPLLACLWIKNKQETPPVEFDKLLTLVNDNSLLKDINNLLNKKKSGIELKLEPAIPTINAFINSTIINLEEEVADYNPSQKPDSFFLDELLWELVQE